MRETSSSLTNFLNQESVICHNNFIVYPPAPVKLNFAGPTGSGIDMQLAKNLNSNFVVYFSRKHTQTLKLQGKFNVKCSFIYI